MPPAMRLARNHEILGADPEDAGLAGGAAVAGELRSDFVRPQRHQIHRRRADEGGDEGGRGLLVDVERIADLLDPAAIHHHQDVGERHRLELVVGDVDRGGLRAGAAICGFRRASRCAAWRRGWTSGSSNRNTFGCRTMARPIATRWRWPPESCRGLRSSMRAELENARGFLHAGVDLGLRHAAVAQAIGHVVVDAHMRIERVVLEHHGDVAVGRLDRR